MPSCTLTQVAELSGGYLRQGNPMLKVKRVHTDTRTLEAGDCYVALRGENFDGHDYLAQAEERGAVAAMVAVSTSVPLSPKLGLVEVTDTLRGLQTLAGAYRRLLPVCVIGVTGSSGKTSTKELIAAVLRVRYRAKATEGNLNNHIGVPLTLLKLEENDDYGVIEMGMNHPGEIAPLVCMAAPKIGIISNIGSAHLEHFQDQAALAHEKAELIALLPEDGVAILNGDNAWSRRLANRTSARVVWVGEGTDWFAEAIVMEKNGLTFQLHHRDEFVSVTLPVFNRVMIQNALLAAAVGHECGLTLKEIARGLVEVKLPGARMNLQKRGNTWVINDAYNANPESMRAALLALKEFPEGRRRVAVLGTMGELGAHAAEFHDSVGRSAAEQGIDFLITIGPQAEAMAAGARNAGMSLEKIICTEQTLDAAKILFAGLQGEDVVLLKGSHFMCLEKIMDLWPQEACA